MSISFCSSSRRPDPAAFTIIEIALSLTIIATAFLAILSMLPAGLDAAQRATRATVVSNILDSVHQRLIGEPLVPRAGNGISFSPAMFDAQGTYVPPDAADAERARAVYSVEVTLADWAQRPLNTSSLRVATIAISSPVDGRTGKVPAGVKPYTTVSYPVTAVTGTDWPAIAREYTPSPEYVPKIEF